MRVEGDFPTFPPEGEMNRQQAAAKLYFFIFFSFFFSLVSRGPNMICFCKMGLIPTFERKSFPLFFFFFFFVVWFTWARVVEMGFV